MNKTISVIIALIVFLLFVMCKERDPFANSSYFVDSSRCTGCRSCIRVCPVDAIRIVDNKAVIDPKRCIHDGLCVEECPEDAIF